MSERSSPRDRRANRRKQHRHSAGLARRSWRLLQSREIEADFRIEDALDFANLLLRQVEGQQEVRDRWFNYYLLITGATIALSTTVLKIFQTAVAHKDLYIIAAIPLLLTGIIGICFFNLYLRQRRNYVNHYAVLGAVQRLIAEQGLSLNYDALYPKRPPLERQPRGADYFTIWVQIVLASSYFGAAAALLEVSVKQYTWLTAVVGIGTALISALVFNTIRGRFEEGKTWRRARSK